MAKTILGLLSLAVLFVPLVACQKLPERPLATKLVEGAMRVEPVKFKDAIPMDYGSLVGVLPHTHFRGWAGLWFEKRDKSIVVVWVNALNGDVLDDVVVIPRR